jgi:hypothetical protein
MRPPRHAVGGTYAWACELAPIDFPLQLLAEKPKPPPKPDDQVSAVPVGQATAFTRTRAYLAQCDPPVSGQGGRNQTFKIAVCFILHPYSFIL